MSPTPHQALDSVVQRLAGTLEVLTDHLKAFREALESYRQYFQQGDVEAMQGTLLEVIEHQAHLEPLVHRPAQQLHLIQRILRRETPLRMADLLEYLHRHPELQATGVKLQAQYTRLKVELKAIEHLMGLLQWATHSALSLGEQLLRTLHHPPAETSRRYAPDGQVHHASSALMVNQTG